MLFFLLLVYFIFLIELLILILFTIFKLLQLLIWIYLLFSKLKVFASFLYFHLLIGLFLKLLNYCFLGFSDLFQHHLMDKVYLLCKNDKEITLNPITKFLYARYNITSIYYYFNELIFYQKYCHQIYPCQIFDWK